MFSMLRALFLCGVKNLRRVGRGVFLLGLFCLIDLPSFAAENEHLNPILRLFHLGQSDYTTLNPANALAREVFSLYGLITWIGVAIFAIVAVVFVVVVYRFREKKNPNPTDMHGNFILEFLWTSIPLLILILVAIPTIRLTFKLAELPKATKGGVSFSSSPDVKYPEFLEINVVGHQWWWEFEYVALEKWDDAKQAPVRTLLNRSTANEPLLPVNIPVKLNIVSEDVIHSFWLPSMIGKVDTMPGHINHSSMLFEKTGFYKGLCALYCGASHAKMRFNVRVVERDVFQQWLDWGKGTLVAPTESAKRGQLYAQNCMVCHTMKGMRDFVPRVTKLEQAMTAYKADLEVFLAAQKATEPAKKVWERQAMDSSTSVMPPSLPVLFQGPLVTIAPDLTDFRFHKFLAAGIKENNQANLIAWIEDPPAIKPEIQGTPTIRMPAYKHAYSPAMIQDVVNFLYSAQYSNSKPLVFKDENVVEVVLDESLQLSQK